MIGMRTILEVADNSGARKLQCILPRGGDLGLRAGLGDVITASVKEASPDGQVQKGKVVKAVIVRTRKEHRRRQSFKDEIPAEYRWRFWLNPAYPFVRMFQAVIVDGCWPQLHITIAAAGIAAASLGIGYAAFKSYENKLVFRL